MQETGLLFSTRKTKDNTILSTFHLSIKYCTIKIESNKQDFSQKQCRKTTTRHPQHNLILLVAESATAVPMLVVPVATLTRKSTQIGRSILAPA